MKKTITVRDIDFEAWKKFKILCLTENITISDKLNEILKKEINR